MSTGYKQEKIDIENLFSTAWGSTTAIAYENVPFDATTVSEYAQLEIMNGSAQEISLHSQNQVHRFSGVVQLRFYTALGTGTNRAHDLVDQASAIFRGVKYDNITFRTPYVRKIGQDGNFDRTDLLVNFFRDDLYNPS